MTGLGTLVEQLPPNRQQSYLAKYVKVIKKKLKSKDEKKDPQKFVVLCWRRTGSNWLCGMLYQHPEIFMHNELFNPVSIHSYHHNLIQHIWCCLKVSQTSIG